MQLIRTLRHVLGIRKNELAETADVSLRQLTRIEQSDVIPPAPTIERLDKALEKMLRARELARHRED
jgi:predicted transcriptional regulator